MITCMEAIVKGEPRDALKGKWTLGGGIEIPCIYTSYGSNTNKRYVRKKI